MEAVDKPGLGSLVGSLDWNHPLGLTQARAKGRVQCYADFLKAKRAHSKAVVLVRIGDFYEAVGFDALVLCQHCSLNPMAPGSGIAEAGFPKAAGSLRRHLNRLIEGDFTVAIVEEVGDIPRTRYNLPSKVRKLVGLVNASSPYYLHGDVEDDYEGDDTPLPKPITGVSIPSGGGFRLLRYCPQRRTILVHSQLSTEALVAHLHATGLAQPLHLHASVRARERDGSRVASLARVLSASLGATVAEYGSSRNDVEEFRQVVGRQVGLDRDAVAAMQTVTAVSDGHTPIPPSLSTVTQLGLAGARGVPSLLSAALPDGTPAPSRDWLRRLLLLPPPPTVAEDIRKVCEQLAAPSMPPLPPLVTSVPGARIAALVGDLAAGHNTLRDIHGMLAAALALLELPRSDTLHCALSGVLAWSLNTHAGLTVGEVPAATLALQCKSAAAAIAAVVPLAPELGSQALFEAADSEADTATSDAPGKLPTDSTDDDDVAGGLPAAAAGAPALALAEKLPRELWAHAAALWGTDWRCARDTGLRGRALEEAGRLVARLERFRLMVRDVCMPDTVKEVADARSAMVAALLGLASGLQGVGAAADLRVEKHDDAVWARLIDSKGKRLSADKQRAAVELVRRQSGLDLVHPRNRKGAPENERLSTQALEDAVAVYRVAVDRANKQAREVLRNLCTLLNQHMVTLLTAAELSVIVTALERHLVRVKHNGWNWPAMPLVHTLATASASQSTRLVLPGLFPYWMDRREAVANDVVLEAGRMALLTGPNMAGKSTVLRAIAAAALLASAGLAVPAASGAARPSAEAGALAEVGREEPPAAEAAGPSHGSRTVQPCGALEASWFSHVSLRNFSGDSPLEGKSAFAVEMEDASHTLDVARSVGSRCLVLLDEMGKGTEVVAGSALAAGVLEALCRARCAGVFATHLHDLVFLLQPQQRDGLLECWAMEVSAPGGQGDTRGSLLRPTHRVRRGDVCLRSLALQVAAECGIPQDVIASAARYEARLSRMMERARTDAYAAGSTRAADLAPCAPAPPPSAMQQAAQPAEDPAASASSEEALAEEPATMAVSDSPPATAVAAAAEGGSLPGVDVDGDAGLGAGLSVAPYAGSDAVQAVVAPAALAAAAATRAHGPEAGLADEGPSNLDAAADELRSIVRRKLVEAGCAVGPADGQLHWVQPGWKPAASHKGEAAVYVARWWDERVYVGETEDIEVRVTTHRATETRERNKLGQALRQGKRNVTSLAVVYTLVPRTAGGKSTALDVEAELIALLRSRGLELRSAHDASRKPLHRPQMPSASSADSR